MGWKIVRDGNQAWTQKHGVSGQWRKSSAPETGLLKKLFEEVGEYAETLEPGELYDVRDVVNRLIELRDPEGKAYERYARKVALMGRFDDLIEWTPIPVEAAGDEV